MTTGDRWDGANLLHQWVESMWTIPCSHGGGYARDCTRCIHETLYASDWLAAHDAKVKAEALREADAMGSPRTDFADGWRAASRQFLEELRERADRIESQT